MLVHVNDLGVTAVAAGRISPGGISILPKPDFECIEKDAVRIVWIDRDALVVPVLIVVGVAAAAVRNRSSGRAGNLGPCRSAIRRTPCGTLAAGSSATRLCLDCLHLRV